MMTAPSGTTRYLCPVRCGWHHDVPPPTADDAAGIPVPPDVTNIGDAISYLAGEASLRTAASTEAALVAHLDTHTTLEFVTVIEQLHAEVRKAAPGPDFFQPDHTYTRREDDTTFLCATVTTHPRNGARVALGWNTDTAGWTFLVHRDINAWRHQYDGRAPSDPGSSR